MIRCERSIKRCTPEKQQPLGHQPLVHGVLVPNALQHFYCHIIFVFLQADKHDKVDKKFCSTGIRTSNAV